MNNFRSILYWIVTFFVIIALWPILKWLILILIVLAIYLFYRLRKNMTVHTFNMHDDFGQDEYNDYERPNIDHGDVIDVEVEVKEEERVEER